MSAPGFAVRIDFRADLELGQADHLAHRASMHPVRGHVSDPSPPDRRRDRLRRPSRSCRSSSARSYTARQPLDDLGVVEVDGGRDRSGEGIRLRSSVYRLSSARSKVWSTLSKTASPMRECEIGR